MLKYLKYSNIKIFKYSNIQIVKYIKNKNLYPFSNPKNGLMFFPLT